MTLASTNSRVSYTGNGVTTSFSFPYYFVNKSDLVVYVDGVLKVLNTDYTIAGTAPFPSGQNIVFGAAPANGTSIVIARVVPYTQTLDLVENDPLPAEDVEKRFDLTTMMIQQIYEQLGRALVIPITDITGTSVTIPDAAMRANQALLFDASGNVSVGLPSSATISAAMQPVASAATLAAARTAMDVEQRIASLSAVAPATGDYVAISDVSDSGNSKKTLISDILALSPFNSNGIINPAFDIWQRGTSFTPSASTVTYTADRWAAYRATNANFTISRQTGAEGSQYCARIARNNGTSNTDVIQFAQSFESANSYRYANKKATLRFKARAGANYSAASGNLNAIVATGTGTDQQVLTGLTGSATPINTNVVLTTSWQTFTITSAAALSASLTQLAVVFNFTPVGTAGAADYFEIDDVEIIEGETAPAVFQRLPVGVILAQCQRHYEKSFPYATAPAQNAGGIDNTYQFPTTIAAATTQYPTKVPFTVRKRTAPTITFFNYAAANAQARNIDAGADCTTTVATTPSENGFGFSCVGPAGGTVGQRIVVHWTADAEL